MVSALILIQFWMFISNLCFLVKNNHFTNHFTLMIFARNQFSLGNYECLSPHERCWDIRAHWDGHAWPSTELMPWPVELSHTVLPGNQQLVWVPTMCLASTGLPKVHVSGKKAENQIYFLFKKYFVLQNIKNFVILKKENKARVLIPLDFKTYYKTVAL